MHVLKCCFTVVSLFCIPHRLSGCSPFQGETNEETLRNIIAIKYEIGTQNFNMTSAMAKDFIQKLLVKNPMCVVL